MIKIVDDNPQEIKLCNIPENTPIFAKKGGKLKGMLLKEPDGWITRIGGNNGHSGHYTTRTKCFDYDSKDFDFFIED